MLQLIQFLFCDSECSTVTAKNSFFFQLLVGKPNVAVNNIFIFLKVSSVPSYMDREKCCLLEMMYWGLSSLVLKHLPLAEYS